MTGRRGGRVGRVRAATTLFAVTVFGAACSGPGPGTPAGAATQAALTNPAATNPAATNPAATNPAATSAAASSAATRAAAVSTTASRSLAGRVIVVDPGHNGGNARHPEIARRLVDIGNGRKACDSTGTQTNAGYAENAFTWDVANRIAAVLRARGATVVLTRTSNTGVGPCITERAAIGNRAGADAAISVHADGGPPAGYGFHVIAPAPVGGNSGIVAPSRRLATTVRDAFTRGTGEPYSTYTGGGQAMTVRSDLGGLNLSRVPKIFIECGNMRNAADAARLSDPAWRQRAATAIADGLTAYLSRS